MPKPKPKTLMSQSEAPGQPKAKKGDGQAKLMKQQKPGPSNVKPP